MVTPWFAIFLLCKSEIRVAVWFKPRWQILKRSWQLLVAAAEHPQAPLIGVLRPVCRKLVDKETHKCQKCTNWLLLQPWGFWCWEANETQQNSEIDIRPDLQTRFLTLLETISTRAQSVHYCVAVANCCSDNTAIPLFGSRMYSATVLILNNSSLGWLSSQKICREVLFFLLNISTIQGKIRQHLWICAYIYLTVSFRNNVPFAWPRSHSQVLLFCAAAVNRLFVTFCSSIDLTGGVRCILTPTAIRQTVSLLSQAATSETTSSLSEGATTEPSTALF